MLKDVNFKLLVSTWKWVYDMEFKKTTSCRTIFNVSKVSYFKRVIKRSNLVTSIFE
jgi:hypothetical protein